MRSEAKVIECNLLKTVKAVFQAREYITSGFGTRVELEVRLIEAEDVNRRSSIIGTKK
jgi:hypothetical protein